MNNIFYEKQYNGLCRMHSLNGYFNKKQISEEMFNKYCKEFNQYIKIKFNCENKCEHFDLINSDQNTIISYILKKYNTYSIFIPLNYVDQYFKERNLNIEYFFDISNYIFIFNQTHIWGIRKYNNDYYKVDSLSGVSKINIYSYIKQKNIGLIITINNKNNIINEFKYNICKIKEYLIKNNTYINRISIDKLLKNNYDKKLLLDNLELYIGICIDILETLNIHLDIVRIYYEFNNIYINNNYKFNPIKQFISDIIIRLIGINWS